MSEIKVDKISPQSGTALAIGDSGDTISIPSGCTITNSGTATGFGGGKVLQVVQNHCVAHYTQSFSAKTITAVTPLNADITCASASSKVLVQVRWCGEPSAIQEELIWGIQRGTTDVGMPTASLGTNRSKSLAVTWSSYLATDHNSTADGTFYQYIDAPSSTSLINYKATVTGKSTFTLWTNRPYTYADDANIELTTSSITLWELDGATTLLDGS